jgi:multisubunit Na+/H+ antiporter MnhG subunit
MCFAPYPNLSLNIGILTTPRWVSISIAILGSLIQLSFFAFAAIITFYRPGLYKDGKAPETWAFVLTMLGTSLVVFGMILCAFLIERKSRER